MFDIFSLSTHLQAPKCEHAFCSVCIKEWLNRQTTCPVDRTVVTISQLKPVPRIQRNLLAKLSIRCDQPGCTMVVKLDRLQDHFKDCEFNPKKPVDCPDCGVTIPKDVLESHACIRDLRLTVFDQEMRIKELEAVVRTLKGELILLKGAGPRLRLNIEDAPSSSVAAQLPEMTERWIQTLPRARVTRWGGMISTPDATLQEAVRKAMIDSHCPIHLANELIENSHERRWPPGLSTLEIRQINRRDYDNYVCRKIPGQQAVIALASENQHINEDMILEPGLVMIFAHGIE